MGASTWAIADLAEMKESVKVPRETLENPADLRDNGPVIAGPDKGDGRQAAWFLGLRADHGQEADQTREVSL